MSACTLAAVLETNGTTRASYIDKVVATLPRWEDILIIQSGANDGTPAWSTGYLTDATAAYFNTVLAVDILHDDLAARSANISYPGLPAFTNQLSYAEFLMEQEFNHFYGIAKPVYNLQLKDGSTLSYASAPNNYPPAKEAAMILWKLYNGTFNSSDRDSNSLLNGGILDNGGAPYPNTVSGYLPEMAARVNNSGTYSEGPGYAYAAWGLDRDERSHLIDLLEFTGKDVEFGTDFYTNPKFISFYEWLYGFASTPFGLMTGFSDTHALRLLSDDGHGGNSWTTSSHIGQASRFSAKAGDYAAWKNRGEPHQGRLLNYLLYSPATGNSRPESRIYTNGGAFFLSRPVDDYSLYGALWNVKEPTEGQPVFHARKDVNALYLAAYGSPLLMNGGFCGAVSPAGPDGCSGVDEGNVRTYFDGVYLGDRAVSNNVAIANYTVGNYLTPNQDNITTNFGSGVAEGFTGYGLDYAAAEAGDFFPVGTHNRSFLLVHPDTNTRGYFVVFDEFSGVGSGNISLAFHPNAISRTEIAPLTEYSTNVFRRFVSDASTGLDFFFATAPSNINFFRGIIASSSGGAIVPEYFFNTYPLNPDGSKNIATILFPFNSTHAKAAMTRISGNGVSGASINHGNVVDYIFESLGANSISQSGATFTAKAVYFRNSGGSISSFFVRKARSFSNGAANIFGFSSSAEVSLYLNGRLGNIAAPATSVTFRYPGITAVKLDGNTLSPTQTGNGFVTVNVPAGTHSVELLAGPTGPTPTTQPVPGDANLDGKVDGVDYVIWLNHYNQNVSGANNGDFNNSGVVDGADYIIWLNNYDY